MKYYSLCLAACFTALLVTPSFGQNAALNSKWDSTYESFDGDDVAAKVTLSKTAQSQFGSGKYATQYGTGTFSQVRSEVAKRKKSPKPASNQPLPGPNSPASGSTTTKAVYLKGVWDYQQTKGWFSWEIYETPNGICKFVGKWGEIANGQVGPTKGNWTGTLDNGNQGGGGTGNQGGNGTGPLYDIPF